MKIIILGAGQTGSALAEYLVTENNDVTVIDEDGEKLLALQERFDLQVIPGNVSYPHILDSAGAHNADMIVAVTNSDEANMLACQIAHLLFAIPQKVARIRAPEYSDDAYPLFASTGAASNSAISIDNIISPERLITQHISKLIQYPGTLQIASFCDNKIYLVAVTAYYGGALVGSELSELKEHLPYVEAKIIAIYRNYRFIRPIPSTIIEAGDLIYFVTIADNIKAVTSELQRLEKPCKRIIISGGGNIAVSLAKQLENDYQVKLIEHNADKAQMIAEQLPSTTVLYGEPSDQELLSREQVELTDLFIAVTSDDESNIMSSMLAKRLGAKKVIVLIQRQAYLELINESVIDIAISPQYATISALLSHIRQSGIEKVISLSQGSAEVIEIVVRGDKEHSKLVGRTINEIRWPSGVTIGAIIRGNDVIFAQNDFAIKEDDHMIIFIPDRRIVSEITKLL